MANAAHNSYPHGPYIEYLADNPDLLALHQLDPERYPYFLESTSSSGTLGRYDILFGFPGQKIIKQNTASGDFLNQLNEEWSKQRDSNPVAAAEAHNSIPFTGGWFLFLSYELAAEIEHLPTLDTHNGLPIAIATQIPLAVIFDHTENKTCIVIEQQHTNPEQLTASVTRDLQHIKPVNDEIIRVEALTEEPAPIYLEAIASAKKYIRDGDIFQANLSREWKATLDVDTKPHSVFSRLRKSNPSPFAGLARIDSHHTIISSSPERLVEVRQNHVRTRPIAGTFPREPDPVKDKLQSKKLLAHPKERAEHIMLIDLERNDLGRICKPGTVTVPELMVLESYRHVHHIVSEVSGELEADVSPVDVIAATFPGGTITGCPKIRCMEIISELERGRRGAYTGSMGYLNYDGSMDLNILIRTMVQNDSMLSFRAGAGIVADSDPQRELNETRAKAEGMIRALR